MSAQPPQDLPGLPNCEVIFVSPDGGAVIAAGFLTSPKSSFFWLWPRFFPELETVDCRWARSRLEDGTILISLTELMPRDVAPHYASGYLSKAATMLELAAEHQEQRDRIAAQGKSAVRLTTAEAYIADARRERADSARFEIDRLYSGGGLGAIKPRN